MSRYDPIAAASDAELPTHSSSDQSDSEPAKPARRSFSNVVFPPQLSYPVPDPLAPFKRHGDHDDDDDSSASSDSGIEGYQDGDAADEKERLVEEGEQLMGSEHWQARQSAKTRRRQLLFTILPTVLLFGLFTAFFVSQLFSGRHTFRGQGLKKITMDHIANGTFSPERERLDWLAEAGDGVYSYRTSDGSIVLQDVKANLTTVLVDGDLVRDTRGAKLDWARFKVSADLKYILFDTAYTKQWRHSSHANFWIHTVETSETVPLRPESNPPHTAIAHFSPKDHHIAYVHANDLYVLEGPPDAGDGRSAIRITADGSPTTFNGVPDWVYEEEVFSADSATWWSPDGSKIAYLSFDEHDVPEYEFPIYNPSPWTPGADPYPTEIVMRYPKPGYPNPKVKIHVFDLAKYIALPVRPSPWSSTKSTPEVDPRVAALTYTLVFADPFAEADTIISEVTWVGKDDLVIKATDRTAKMQRVAHFKLGDDVAQGTIVGEVVREDDYGEMDGGWAEPGQTIVGIDSTILLHSERTESAAPIPSYPPGYLDIVPDSAGFNHLAYYSSPESKSPVFLTSGEWEIDGRIQAVDVSRGLVYFIAANPSIERHLYSVPLPSVDAFAQLACGSTPPKPNILTNTTSRGYYSASFSPFGGLYVLNYEGPSIPWQRLVNVDDKDYVNVLADNAALAKVDSEFQHVDISYGTVESDGHELYTMELRPPLMDLSGRTKYPVLFQVYGGPGSQLVSTRWARDWHHYLCTSLGYVVVRVDPRGTGYKGRRFRMPVRGRLGELEALDVVNTARYYADLPYVDEKRLGVWGWSYGGFLTSKIVETNSSVFTLGMSVAPVTDWRYYDSIYTERYMSTPELNPVGYHNSSVHAMEGFKHMDFALAHGSGDDNVHFLNTAALLDRLTSAHVRGWRFRMFTDSDHSISKRGSYWQLMGWLTDFLVEKWGEGGRTKNKWKMEGRRSEGLGFESEDAP